MFKHYSRRPQLTQAGYNVTDIANAYNFPQADGSGQTIGIIELGGGFSTQDLHAYAQKLGLPGINITAVDVDGGVNAAGQDPSGADGEVLLDIEIIYGIVPKANIRVYFADNSDKGFMDAVKRAISDKVDIISISWGGSEKTWSSTTIQEFETVFQQAANAGITVLAAAGDSGADDDSGDGCKDRDVDYPGSSPWVTSCGGTQITAISDGFIQEVVWNNLAAGDGATGGGMSSLFTRPAWQTRDHIDKPNRCVPDISANASPLSGYNVIVDDQWTSIGGTSSVSPLMAGLVARLNQILGKNIGYLNPVLYALNEQSWYDVTQGNNGYWKSGANYDLASGLGRLRGDTLVDDIKWAILNKGN